MGEGYPPPTKKIVTQEIFNKIDSDFYEAINHGKWLNEFRKNFADMEFPDSVHQSFLAKQLESALLIQNSIESIKVTIPDAGSEVFEVSLTSLISLLNKGSLALSKIKQSIEDVMSEYEVGIEDAYVDVPVVIEPVVETNTTTEEPVSELVATKTAQAEPASVSVSKVTPTPSVTPLEVVPPKMAVLSESPYKKKTEKDGRGEELLEQLLDDVNDPFGFLLVGDDSAERGKKPLRELRADLLQAFKADGIKSGEVDNFFGTVFSAQANEISAAVKKVKATNNQEVRHEMDLNIKAAYLQIRESAVALVMTSRSDKETGLDDSELILIRSEEEIKSDLKTAKDVLAAFIEENKATPGFLEDPLYLETERALEIIEASADVDPNTYSLKLENYLKSLWEKINALTDKYVDTIGVITAPDIKTNLEQFDILDEKIVIGVEELKAFYADLPREFFDARSYIIEDLDKASDNLLKARDEENIVRKTKLVSDFTLALVTAQAELNSWQEIRSRIVEDAAKMNLEEKLREDEFEDSVVPSVDPLDDLNEEVAATASEEVLSSAEQVLDFDIENLPEALRNISLKSPASLESPDSKSLSVVEDVVTPDPRFEIIRDDVAPPALIDFTDIDDVSSAVVKPSLVDTTDVVEVAQKEPRHELFDAKKGFREKEAAFNIALREHYDSGSLVSRLMSGKKVLGIGADLPESLQSLRQEYREARALYAMSLDQALLDRASQTDKDGHWLNKPYATESETTKAAFARRFILKPQERQLAMQERNILSPEQSARLKRVMGTLAEHKWLIRGMSVAAVGVVGGVSGGLGLALAGASFQAGKIALSAGAAVAANKGVRAWLKNDVNKIEEQLVKTEAGVKSDFSLSQLIDVENERSQRWNEIDGELYGEALLNSEAAAKNQRNLSMAAAVLAGGATGALSGAFYPEVALAATSAPVSFGAPNGLVPEKIIDTEPVAEKGENAVMDLVKATRLERGPVVIERLLIPLYTPEGEAVPALELSNISFGPKTNIQALSVSEQADLVKFVRLAAEDLVADSPNIAESKLESLVFEKIEKAYGSASWWKEANFTKFDGTYEVSEPAQVREETPTKEAPTKVTAPESVREKVSTATSNETASTKAYEIKSGNTLGGIIENQFKDKLSSIPAGARGAALDVLYEKLNGKPEVLAEMGIKSGDVDLIYSGEKIDLAVLERELDRVIERQNIIERFKTGPLNIEGDNEVKSVQIKTPDSVPLVNEVVASANETSTPFFEDVSNEQASFGEVVSQGKPVPALNDYELNRAVAASVKNFEAKTYDPFDKLLGSYQSPYAELKSMTLRDFTEFRKADASEIKTYLSDNRIKYETYLAWTNKIDELAKNLPHKPSTTIEDLVVKSVREEALSRTNRLT